jgi:hypothetical protein
MLALFSAVYHFMIDTDSPPNGLTKNHGSVELSIVPHGPQDQSGLQASTVMAVMKGIMYIMSKEVFTQRSIQIRDATKYVGDAMLGTSQQIAESQGRHKDFDPNLK